MKKYATGLYDVCCTTFSNRLTVDRSNRNEVCANVNVNVNANTELTANLLRLAVTNNLNIFIQCNLIFGFDFILNLEQLDNILHLMNAFLSSSYECTLIISEGIYN